MAKKGPISDSIYVIDGIAQELTPAQLLGAVTEGSAAMSGAREADGTIVDETVDPKFSGYVFDAGNTQEYLSLVLSTERSVPMASAGSYTRVKAATALLDALWQKGHFGLEDLALKASWRWNTSSVGSHAAFYDSARNAAEYVDALGLRFSQTRCTRVASESVLEMKAVLSKEACMDDFSEDSLGADCRALSPKRAVPATLLPDERSWVVYVPFDTSDYRLGGSLLAQALGLGGGTCPDISDADYFMDCYEVIREMVEDGVVISAATVGEGGLLRALSDIAGEGIGLTADVSDIMRANQEGNVTRVLFSEVPGAVIQIRDSDFDYLDAELLLQDVAFYPLGHPTVGKDAAVHVKASAKTGIQTILESLMQNAEGED